MSLSGKMVAQTEIKTGDVFHEICRYRPHHISNMSPDNIQGCHIHEGEWGNSGSIIEWKYTHDGKEKVSKQVIDVNEEKKSITFKVLEGDLMELYKTFIITYHVDTHGDESSTVTWTLEFEKLNEDVEDPKTFMDFLINITKDMETHHLQTT